MAKMITITSGKGGVGKTGISVNLAIHLAEKGYRTCLFDADLGLANINILLNLYPKYNLSDVLLNKTEIDHILIRNVYGIDIIPGSSGIEEMADLSLEKLTSLMAVFSRLDHYDTMIFDTSAGTSRSVISLCMASEEIVLVIIPEPTSLTDAYALLKILANNGYKGTPRVLVNQCKTPDSAQKIYQKFAETVDKYLPVSLDYMGSISKDSHVVNAVTQQKPVVVLYPNCKATKHLRLAGDELLRHIKDTPSPHNLETFLKRYLQVLKRPLALSAKGKEASTRHIETQERVNAEKDQGNAYSSPPSKTKKEGPIAVPPTPEGASPDLSSAQQPLEISSSLPESDVRKLLSSLIQTMNGVSQELKALRTVAEHMTSDRNGGNPSMAQKETANAAPNAIYIDFEAYRKGSKKP